MKVHYYGRLDNLESCYTYQAFEEEGLSLFLQKIIKNPAMFIKKNDCYYRFVIEGFEVDIKDGKIDIDKNVLIDIFNSALILI